MSGWCEHSTCVYRDVPNPFKIYRGKDCMENFMEHIKDKVKRSYTTFHSNSC